MRWLFFAVGCALVLFGLTLAALLTIGWVQERRERRR